MADPTAIAAVQAQLPDEADSFGFDSVMIGTLLDSGITQTKAILAGWRGIAAKTATYTDVQESGSSRNLSILNANAREMITLWQAQADREDSSAGTLQQQRWRSHTVKRNTVATP